MNKNGDKLYLDLCYLISCSLHSKEPDAQDVNIGQALKLAAFQGVSALAAACLGEKAPQQIKDYIEQKTYALFMMDIEREELFSYCDAHGIWYMPLKGVILSEYYPAFGMREMCDNDILYDSSKQKEVAAFFRERGYSCNLNYGADDEFIKPPVYNFEMHRVLFVPDQDLVWSKYYENVRDRLIDDSDGGRSCGCRFTDEDFYVYVTVHNYKHYRNQGGTGVRCLTDCYVYTDKNKNLNWEYIEEEEKKLGVLDFERMVRALSFKLFAAPQRAQLSEEDMSRLRFFMESGVYGTAEHRVEGQENKWAYLKNRIIPGDVWLQSYVPTVYKHKILMPFFLIGRLWKHRKEAWNEFLIIIKKKKQR